MQPMTDTESVVWQSFALDTLHFFENHKAESYQELDKSVLLKFKDFGVKMSIKVHYLSSYLDCFPAYLGDLIARQPMCRRVTVTFLFYLQNTFHPLQIRTLF